jgi:hypothetical protein
MEMKYTCVLVHVNCISLGRWMDAMDMKNQFVNNLYIRIIGFNIKLHSISADLIWFACTFLLKVSIMAMAQWQIITLFKKSQEMHFFKCL